MDAGQIIFFGWIGSLILSLTCILQILILLLTLDYRVVFKTILGYLLICIWSVAALTVALFTSPQTRLIPILFVVGLFIIATQHIIYSNIYLKDGPDSFSKLVLVLGWVAIGLLITQLLFPEAIFVSITESHGFYYSKVNSILFPILTIRGLFVFYLIGNTIREVAFDERTRSSRPFLILAAVMGILSFTVIFLHFSFANLIHDLKLNNFLFIIARLMVIVAVLILNIGIMKNGRYLIASLNGISGTFFEQKFKIAVYSFNAHGTVIQFSKGFDSTHPDKESAFINLLTLGMAGLSILGRGEDHIEGSAIIPISNGQKSDALIISKWVPSTTTDQSMTYLSILIAVHPKYSWLIKNRFIWEFAIHSFLSSIESLSNLNYEDFIAFTKELLVDIVIHRV